MTISEEIIYAGHGVTVTRTLARFGANTSYPINGIGSVFVRRPTFMYYVTPVIIGGTLAIFGFNKLDDPWRIVLITLGAAFVLGGLFFQPTKLMLRTASGDQQAYENADRRIVEEIKSAIETAIALRG